MTSAGIHHVTLITRKVQANVDFYVGFLGLRLVKRTAGFEDANQLHLFYGDAAGTPGSLITFLVWEDGAAGRAGVGQIGEIALAIDPASIGFWLTRALSNGLSAEGPRDELGEPVLRLKDPDGVIVKLVGAGGLRHLAPWTAPGIPGEHAVGRIRGVTILTETAELTQSFLETHFAFAPARTEGATRRLVSQSGDAVDLRDVSGFWPGAPGTGTVDHVAFRASDTRQVEDVQAALRQVNSSATTMHDRKYFTSLYVREPGGVLFELATDAPGMGIDESADKLGSTLFIPQAPAGGAADFRIVLPQFALPGEPRIVYRDLPFIHRFHVPTQPDGTHWALLHGSGGNETSLMPLAAATAPAATLLGIRGRSTEEGMPRWFRRLTPLSFDQADIRAEAEAFAAFCTGSATAYGMRPDATLHLGHSNGANFLAAFLRLHLHRVRKAILLRPIEVLDLPPQADLAGMEILVVAGADDPLAQRSLALADNLRKSAARVDVMTVPAGHDFGEADQAAMRGWLADHPVG
ncbi:VOC family protein [Nitratireductor soli]|uniref:VOC family protein n=1 Tax=Nitratireductor soli TaxID=1670619 RepID=UPI00065E05CC|nr:VOC family protein [Nitratireductor soli]